MHPPDGTHASTDADANGGASEVPDPPSVTCPPSISQTSTSPAGTPIVFADPAVVGGQAPVAIACTPSSGLTFSTGSTTVECRATDALNCTASWCAFCYAVPAPRLNRTVSWRSGTASLRVSYERLNRLAPVDAGLPSLGLIVVPRSYHDHSWEAVGGAIQRSGVADRDLNQGESGERAREAVPRFLQAFNATRPEVLLLMEGYNQIGTGENGAARCGGRAQYHGE